MQSLTPGMRKILRALEELGPEGGLMYVPRRGIYQVGKNGPAASWRTFKALEDRGLIKERMGFACGIHARVTTEEERAGNCVG